MKKVILAAMLLAGAGAMSSFTIKNDTASSKSTAFDKKDLGQADNKKDLGQADNKKDLGQADNKKDLGQADARKRTTANDKKDLGQAD